MIFMLFINLYSKGLQEPGVGQFVGGSFKVTCTAWLDWCFSVWVDVSLFGLAFVYMSWCLVICVDVFLFDLMLYNARFLFYYFFGDFFHEFEPLGIWFFSFLMIFMFFMILIFAKPMPCFGAAACFSKPGGSTEASPCEKHGNMEKWAHGRISGFIVQIMNFIFLIFIQKMLLLKIPFFIIKAIKT